MKAPAGLERTISLCFLHKASAIIIVTSPKKSTPDFTKNSHSQRFLYLLPEGQLLRLRGRFRQGRVHKDGIRADGLDLLPGDGQALVPAQQPEQPGPPQQDQALQPGGSKSRSSARPRHTPRSSCTTSFSHNSRMVTAPLPFLPQLMPGRQLLCKKAVETGRRFVLYYKWKFLQKNRGSFYV